MNRRILMIVTSHDRLGDTGKPTGFWAEELAAPYYALADAGAQVQLASPLGGPVPLDPGSLKPRGSNEPIVERFLADGMLRRHCRAPNAWRTWTSRVMTRCSSPAATAPCGTCRAMPA